MKKRKNGLTRVLSIALAALISGGWSTWSLAQDESIGIGVEELEKRLQGLREEAERAANMGAGRDLQSIPSKETLSSEELRRVRSVQSVFSRDATARITRDGWVMVPYGEVAYMNCSINGFCIIALEPGEEPVQIDVSDSTAWTIRKGRFGPNGIVHTITLKPLYADSYAQAVVMTDRGRVYEIFLDSKPVVKRSDGSLPIHSMKLRYDYPHEGFAYSGFDSPNTNTTQPGAGVTAGDEEAEKRTLDIGTNYELRFVGGRGGSKNPSWKPVRVYADNATNTTYIELPRNFTEIPAVFVLGESGEHDVVRVNVGGTHGNVLAITGVHNKIIMQSLTGKTATKFEAVRL